MGRIIAIEDKNRMIKEAIEMRAAGKTGKEIAAVLNINNVTLYKWLRAHGIVEPAVKKGKRPKGLLAEPVEVGNAMTGVQARSGQIVIVMGDPDVVAGCLSAIAQVTGGNR